MSEESYEQLVLKQRTEGWDDDFNWFVFSLISALAFWACREFLALPQHWEVLASLLVGSIFGNWWKILVWVSAVVGCCSVVVMNLF